MMLHININKKNIPARCTSSLVQVRFGPGKIFKSKVRYANKVQAKVVYFHYKTMNVIFNVSVYLFAPKFVFKTIL